MGLAVHAGLIVVRHIICSTHARDEAWYDLHFRNILIPCNI